MNVAKEEKNWVQLSLQNWLPALRKMTKENLVVGIWEKDSIPMILGQLSELWVTQKP